MNKKVKPRPFLPWLSILVCVLLLNNCSTRSNISQINPNQFEGSDIQRIQSAIEKAKGTTNKVFIPALNSNGTNSWSLDSAILLPGNMTLILDP